jgi:hypothetical protein
MRRAFPLCLLLAACAQDPIRYIPETERMVSAADGARPISVEAMLARARANAPAPTGTINTVPGRLLVRFEPDATAPTPSQRAELREFAQTSPGPRRFRVASRPGTFEDAGALVLGQRRAVAVARELSALSPDVEMRFDPALPPGVVVVTLENRP